MNVFNTTKLYIYKLLRQYNLCYVYFTTVKNIFKTVARLTPLSMGFFWHKYWSRLPFPLPEDLPDPGVEPWSPTLHADSLSSEPPEFF